MADTKLRQTPIITKYKGQKVLNQDSTQTKKIFGFYNKNDTKSPLKKTPTKNVTPTKSIKGAVTPTKQRTTDKKSNFNDSTISSKKWPTTAKK